MVERGLAETRARAQALILGGAITVDGSLVTKPGTLVDPDSEVALTAPPLPYVSRGGLKLRHALDSFDLSVDGLTVVDVGASTGGFTDALLQAGAARVYAIDVGYGQLAWTLRNDPRVVVMERTNIRDVSELPELADLAVIDVSFISLRVVLPAVKPLLRPGGEVIALIKPQFEAGKQTAARGRGVIRDPAVWREILRRVLNDARTVGWIAHGLIRSPITGPAGNVEFLARLSPSASREFDLESEIDRATKMT